MMREVWSKFPFVVEYHFYIFNVTNAEAIKDGAKPIVEEVGPFVYEYVFIFFPNYSEKLLRNILHKH